MSTVVDNKWRQSKRLSGSQRVRPETGPNQATNTQGNVWNKNDGSRPMSGPRSSSKPAVSPASQNSANTTSGVARDEHVSVRGFNSNETNDFLMKSHKDLLVNDPERKCLYRPALDGSAPKGPWGSKPTVMTSGQDFWVQLGKQLAVKES